MELKTPFGSFYPPNISPDPKDGIGSWSAAEFANAVMAGVSPGGGHLYPALPYAVLFPHVDQGHARPLRLPAHDAGRHRPRPAERASLPVLDPTGDRFLEASLHAEDRLSACPRSARSGGARPLSGRGARALRGVPLAPRPARRDHRIPPADRRPAPGRQGQRARHHRARSERLVGKRHFRRAVDRLHPIGRRAWQRHGGSRPQSRASAGGRPRGR